MAGKATIKMSGDPAALLAAQDKVLRKQQQTITALRKTSGEARQAGKSAKSMNNEFGRTALSMANISAALGIVGVAGAVQKIIGLHDVWLRKMDSIAGATTKASNELIAFAALQEGGDAAKQVTAVTNLAAQFGITDRGAAFNTAQALQSALGSPKAGRLLEAKMRYG